MQTVLLIENDPATLVARALVLRSFGYTVLEAGSQEEALHTCQEHPEPIRLVITRAAVDSYHSRELVTRLQLLRPQMRALFVSDESVGGLADKQRLRCECAFIQKAIPSGHPGQNHKRAIERTSKRHSCAVAFLTVLERLVQLASSCRM